MSEAHPALPDGLMEVMKRAALDAGRNALRHKKIGLDSELKPDQSLVTIADQEGEAIIHKALARYGYDFVGEETGVTDNGSDFSFVVDPIDGTTNYSIGDPDWLVSIGLLYKGKPIVGVTYQPELDKLYWAESGKGAWLTQGDQTKTLDQRGKEPAAYVFDILSNRPLWAEVASLHYLLSDAIKAYTEGKQKPRYRSTGCPSVPLCQMAEGARSGLICWPIAMHDVAASLVIAQEAGMQVDLHVNDREKPPYTLEIVASIPQLFEQTLEAFKSVTGKLAHFYRGRSEDGGVEHMRNDGIKYGVSVGRRQPMHRAHLDCIQEMVDAGLHPVIVIGSANVGANPLFNPYENPLNVKQQREQIDIAMRGAGISEYTVLEAPDLGNMEEWASSLRHTLKANGFDPTQCACHYRAKDDIVKEAAQLIRPMKASNESLMRYGLSPWESYNTSQEMDSVSATGFRTMDLRASENQQLMNNTLVAAEFIKEEAQRARFANPDKELLQKLPITMMDLALQRLREERGISTATILRSENAESMDQLVAAIKDAIAKPGTEITGELQLIEGHNRGRA